MDTPDDCRRIAEDPPECPQCGDDLPKLGPGRYGACPRCPDEAPRSEPSAWLSTFTGDCCGFCGAADHAESGCTE